MPYEVWAPTKTSYRFLGSSLEIIKDLNQLTVMDKHPFTSVLDFKIWPHSLVSCKFRI